MPTIRRLSAGALGTLLSLSSCSSGSDANGRVDASTSGSGGYGNADADVSGSGYGNDVIMLPDGAILCQAAAVDSMRITPDIMIVMDRSLSMKWMGIDRWDPSKAAIKTITSSLEDRIRFGLMAFPSTADRSQQNCTPGKVEQPVNIHNAGPIAQSLDGMEPGGYTPTALTLEAAHKALGSGLATPDQMRAAKYVLLVTDGQPNCTNGVAGSGNAEPAAIDASVSAITSMAKDGIKTYVIGYDTQNDPALKATLDRMAQAGDTGDTAHRPVENEQTLQDALSDIAGRTVTCDFVLSHVPQDVHKVQVQMSGKQVNLDETNGWSLSQDGRSITLNGSSCTAMKTGNYTLSVREVCNVVQPI